jgi:parvulin-like peptidyl-prolyl isomerase
MRNTIASLLCVLSIGFAAKAQEGQPDPKDKEVLFSVNDKKVTLGDFKRKYSEVQFQSMSSPPPELFLEDLIRFEVGLLEAKKKNIEKEQFVIDRINQELYKGVVEKAIGDKVKAIKVSDAELKDFYKDNPELRSSHILIEVRNGASKEEREASRKRAQEIYDEVKSSKRGFEELAKLYTDDSFSKATGGDIGWQTRLTVVPAYYNTLMSMKLNEVKGLIETPYGFHIVKLTGRQSFEQANKQALKTAIYDQKRKVIFDEYFKVLKKNYDIKVNTALLK